MRCRAVPPPCHFLWRRVQQRGCILFPRAAANTTLNTKSIQKQAQKNAKACKNHPKKVPKPPQNHPREVPGRVLGRIGAPSEKKVRKKMGFTRTGPSLFGGVFHTFPKKGDAGFVIDFRVRRKSFLSGWCVQKHHKMRSKRYLFQVFAGRADFV